VNESDDQKTGESSNYRRDNLLRVGVLFNDKGSRGEYLCVWNDPNRKTEIRVGRAHKIQP
jgi:hypothetical protein